MVEKQDKKCRCMLPVYRQKMLVMAIDVQLNFIIFNNDQVIN